MFGYCAGYATPCVRSRPARLAFLLTAISLLTLGCAPRSSWEEEVSIAPGETVIVERDARFGSAGAIGSPKFSFPTRQSLRVNLASGATGDWVSSLGNRSDPDSTLRPLYLQRDENGQLVLVVRFYFCEDWVRFDRPSPPYLAFHWSGKEWDPTPVPANFWERASNLLASPGPNTGLRWTAAEIAKRNKNAWEYDSRLRRVGFVPNCGNYAGEELRNRYPDL
ncbi:MAG: hypothetical protein KJ040_08665 [Gammaproteobacteria bacterium]|nr:hypothetical protein [Gammaproteobacteria bacterium]